MKEGIAESNFFFFWSWKRWPKATKAGSNEKRKQQNAKYAEKRKVTWRNTK